MNATDPGRFALAAVSQRDSFFAHHGPWALGVRLFRKLQFSSKAGLISLAFLLPLALLALAYLRNSQATIDFARHELAGVAVVTRIEPWLIEVQKQRRLLLSGLAPSVDVAAIASTMKPVQELVASRPDALDVRGELARVEQAHAALAAQGRDATPASLALALQTYVDGVRELRTTVLDRSNLTLDPDQDTYYLMSLGTDTVSDVIESISRSRAMAGAAEQRGHADAVQLRELYGVWYFGGQRVGSITQNAGHAAEANAQVGSRVKAAEAAQAARAFYEASAQSWFGDSFAADVQALGAPGQQAVDALRAVAQQSIGMLGELLQDRIDRTEAARNAMLAAICVSLLVAAYLFYAFFLVMRGGLQEVSRHLQAMTEGDLTTSPKPWGRDEAAELMQMLSAMQASLRGMVSQVRQASEGIVQASSEIADGASDLSARTEQTAANLQQSAAAMEQISSTVRQTSDHTEEATRIASQNEQIAGRGGVVIGNMVSTMEEIQTSSKKISEIIAVIDSIAFQTNILALNAAVEAARAGEQGRGFAVVAAEVRALAQRSTAAAREIKTLISASVEKVESGTGVAMAAGTAMGEIVASARRINGLLSQIAMGSREQSQGIGQVGTSVQELDRATQQNAAMVEQTAAAASSLRDQAHGLADEVARFKIPA
jgi:methyl-accepting chemotaxis protein